MNEQLTIIIEVTSPDLPDLFAEVDLDIETVEEKLQEYIDDNELDVAVEDVEYEITGYDGWWGFDVLSTWEEANELKVLADAASAAETRRRAGHAYLLYAEHVGDNDCLDSFENAYCGEWSSEEDFARTDAEERYEDLGPLAHYMDWESYARELFSQDYFSIDNFGDVVVFRHC
jgi:antirestriction protein